MSKKTSISFGTLQDAIGTIPYNMMNDYMFRAVLQSSNKALKGLICRLLQIHYMGGD